MLRPSASAAKVSALAAESISASLGWTIGKRIASANTIVASERELRCGAIRAIGTARRSQPMLSPTVIGMRSGSGRRGAAEKAARHEDEHQDEDRKDDDVGPPGGEEMAAQALDEADQYAADHRAGDAADAAQHRGGERPQTRGIADDEAGEIVVETEDQCGRPGQRRAEKK